MGCTRRRPLFLGMGFALRKLSEERRGGRAVRRCFCRGSRGWGCDHLLTRGSPVRKRTDVSVMRSRYYVGSVDHANSQRRATGESNDSNSSRVCACCMDSKHLVKAPLPQIPKLVGSSTVEGLGCETEERGYIRQDLEGTSTGLWGRRRRRGARASGLLPFQPTQSKPSVYGCVWDVGGDMATVPSRLGVGYVVG